MLKLSPSWQAMLVIKRTRSWLLQSTPRRDSEDLAPTPSLSLGSPPRRSWVCRGPRLRLPRLHKKRLLRPGGAM